ncbi:hypothetical protein AB7C87_14290 [Natrarchaeobius sp. A-rgal3]|uniref:hypothetical protein n=1 Tax=Natrarchaeobius versutus TaxID=1679078 RepID=UPI00350F76A1
MMASSAGVWLADPVLWVHVLAGVLALAAGLAAIVTRKGGRRHNVAGRAYALSMVVVVVTAVPLAVWTENWFLLAIAVFSGYLVFGGYRVIARRRTGLTALTPVDYSGHGSMVAVGGLMVAFGGWQMITGPPGLAPALAVFGAIGAGFAVLTLLEFRSPPAERTPWIDWHVGFMGGAYIATVTATITVNLTMVPPLVRWLGPTAVGVPLIVYATRTYGPRFTPAA